MPFGLSEDRYKKIKSVFSRFPAVEEVLAFGSRAMDTYKPASDIDLALIGEKITHDDVIKIGMALDELPYGYTYDIIDYKKNTHKEFKKHIDKYGISFYKKGIIPSKWHLTKLGEIMEVQNGYAFKSNDFSKKGIPIIKIKNIVPPRIAFSDAEFYEGEIDRKLESFLVQKGDILISMTGSHLNQMASAVGKVGKYQFEYPALLNQRVAKLYSKNRKILDEGFLYYCISRPETQLDLVISSSGGGNQANISPSQLKDIEIQLPPIDQQKSISTILSSLDNKIDLNLQMNKTLEDMAQAIFKEWFVEFKVNGKKLKINTKTGLPVGWKKDSIYEIIDVIYGFPFQSKLFNEKKEGMGLIRIRDLKNNSTGFYTTENADDKYIVHAGDILAGMDAEFIPSVWYGEPAWLNQRVCKFKPKDKSIHELFILYSIKPLLEKSQYGKVGTTVIHLGKSDIDRYEITIPSKEVLNMVSNILKPIHNRLIEIEIENRTLSEIRDNLLPKLMSGKIEVKA